MIISCPKCNAGFFVSPQQIGATGRRVKCSKCKNVWHAIIPNDTVPRDDLIIERIQSETVVPGANLPAIIPIKIPYILYTAPSILTVLIILTFWIFYPSVTNKLGLCGSLCVANGMRIEDINYEYDLLSQKVKIEYSVANRSLSKEKVPQVQFKLFDDKHEVIRTVYADSKGIILDPNKTVRAKTEFEGVPTTSKIVEIALGSPLKFWFR